jgi:hypothetical protein
MWKRRFDGTRAILGKSIPIGNRSVSIIGVMPPDFQYPNKQAELWMLLTADPRWPMFQKFRIANAFNGLARLKPGRSIEEASSEMKVLSSKLAKQYPATDTGLDVEVLPLFDQIAEWPVRRALWILGGAALCVLLVACSNIASLLVARGARRRNEIAISCCPRRRTIATRLAVGHGKSPVVAGRRNRRNRTRVRWTPFTVGACACRSSALRWNRDQRLSLDLASVFVYSLE